MSLDINKLKADIKAVLINDKSHSGPLALRLAWHGAGTFCKDTKNGGLNGATMRFTPELSDPANAGLHIAIELLNDVKMKHPEVSFADLWAVAGCAALEFMGGPIINVKLGRSDESDGSKCPVNGRLPDAAQGAQHIRDVFYRMGFNDQEIVALIGAHTLGACHRSRSGFEGPWTRNPYKFDNGFFKNLLFMEWVPRKWKGPLQFEDADTGELMMLPADLAVRDDPAFRVWAEKYAADEALFFKHFAHAFAKLISLGLSDKMLTVADESSINPPAVVQRSAGSENKKAEQIFLELAVEGNADRISEMIKEKEIPNAAAVLESKSNRTALHKACFGGHEEAARTLIELGRVNINAVDFNGDSALHDAARFGNEKVIDALMNAGADVSIVNKDGRTAADIAKICKRFELASKLSKRTIRL